MLIVDDSVVMRVLLSDIIAAEARLEVAGVAANGKVAIEKISQLNPDIVLLDVEMPIMDGISTLKEIKKIKPNLPVIMVSALTEKGAHTTLEALSHGAAECVTKPSQMGSADAAKAMFREQIIPKIFSLCSIAEPILANNQTAKVLQQIAKKPSIASANRVDLVVIGVSTGGPNALEKVITKFPEDMPVPVVLVQHMPPVFTKSLAERLNSKSKVKVLEADEGMVLVPGTVLVAPGGKHTIVVRDAKAMIKIKTNMEPPENSCRPAVDVLFRSALNVAGSNLLAVVMTGMGQDGFRGCEQIAHHGGQIIVQDEKSSVVWGMPGFVARAGLAEMILPVDELADEIIKRAKLRRISAN